MTAIDTDVKQVERMFNVNVFGPMRMLARFHPSLVNAKGLMINIGSVGGIVPFTYGCGKEFSVIFPFPCPLSPISQNLQSPLLLRIHRATFCYKKAQWFSDCGSNQREPRVHRISVDTILFLESLVPFYSYTR
jgi:NAD(P)-dependent dehydrogenase (short-subunit alcohol dehydrogenase family)